MADFVLYFPLLFEPHPVDIDSVTAETDIQEAKARAVIGMGGYED